MSRTGVPLRSGTDDSWSESVGEAMEDKDCRSLAGTVGDSATSWPGEGLATAVASASASVCASTVQMDPHL